MILKSPHFKSILLLLCLIFSVNAFSQVTISDETFDTDINTDPTTIWNDGGGDCAWRSADGMPFASNPSIRLRDNSGVGSSMTTDNLALSLYSSVDFTFDFEGNGMNNGHDFWLQYSSDGGSNWTTIFDYNFNSPYSNNVQYNSTVTINASSYGGTFSDTSQFRIRCDSGGNANQVYIDNVKIIGTCTPPGQPSVISGVTSPCIGSSQVFSVTNVGGNTYNWSFPSGWIQTAGGTSNSITVTVGTGTGNISVTPNNGLCDGPTRNLSVTVNLSPSITGTTPGSRSGSGTVNLGATVSSGTITWWNASSGGINLGTGTSFITPTISTSTTYYVDANDGTCTSPSRVAVVATINGPEINIVGNGTNIIDAQTVISTSDDTDFGAVNSTSGAVAHTFTIQNTGNTNLSISNPVITGDIGDFILSSNPSSPVTASGNTTFTIAFDPTVVGTRSAIVSITNNDTDENPYSFSIQGEGVSLPTISEIGPGGDWNYLDDGSDQGTAWYGVGFDDSSWTSGDAELGYGDGDETTIVNDGRTNDANSRTTYFRKSFTVTASESSMSTLVLNAIRDDGMIVYINGVEVWRDNLPTGAINYDTDATDAGGTEDEWQTLTLENILTTGTNEIAVEIHQMNGTSSDISFDFSMEVNDDYKIIPGGVWSYQNATTYPGAAWNTTINGTWPTANTEIGYGDGDETTIISTAIKTAYFTKAFTATATDVAFKNLVLNAIRDDGMIVYLNGVEVWRDNYTGAFSHDNYAAVGNVANEEDWISTTLTNNLVLGTNIVAVAVTQDTNTSSDLNFNCYLVYSNI